MLRAMVPLACCLAVACAASPSVEAGATPTTSSVAPSPIEVETFVDPMPDPPELRLVPDGDDFEPVIREIFAFRAWLFGNPDQSRRIEEIYQPDCHCRDVLAAELDDLHADGHRILGQDEFATIDLVDASPNSRSLIVERVSSQLVRIDASNAVVARLDRVTDGRKLVQLTSSDDGTWRIQSIRGFEEPRT